MNMKSILLTSAGLLSAFALLNLSGCNAANSGDTPSTGLAEPTAELAVTASSRSMTAAGYYYENTNLTVLASSEGSEFSSSTCVLTFDYKSAPTADFVTQETKESCNDYEFNLYSGPGVYRWSLEATDENGKVADTQIFATAITDPAADVYLPTNPDAEVRIISASTTPDANGYYVENTVITSDLLAIGSQRSTVTCEVTLDYQSNDDGAVFTNRDTVNSCDVQDFNLDNGPGIYRVKLVVTDGNDLIAEDQKFVIATSTDLLDRAYLTADFTFNVAPVADSLFDVEFNGRFSSESDTGDAITEFKWEVFVKNDDTETPYKTIIGLNPKPTVTVDRDGIYVTRLTITDELEQTAVTEKMFKVGGTGQTLIADFSVTIPSGAPVNIQVDASASTIGAGVDHYEWELISAGDTNETVFYQLDTESPTTVLPVAYSGIYYIRLTVIDVDGNEHEITRVVTIPVP
ncbi:MAG: hypothetical protein JXK16_07330 [Thiotrichales bacterium]|nr:hypothetical protein [Thiotrichales bacterium]